MVDSQPVGYSSLLIVSLGMLLVLAGCGPVQDANVGSGPEEMELNAKDRGGQVEVEVGQILVLTLDSNATTGFRWEVVELDDSFLRQRGGAEYRTVSESDPPPPGTGGVEVFRFEAVAVGETALTLVYHQPWQEDVEPVGTFSVQVVVR